MSLPREVIPGRFYMVTRRCTQRQFLLRPDADTNNAFLYCLADAAQRCNITVLLTCALSNHHHTIVFDPEGKLPAFTEHFHKLLAKSQNALRGRWENFWAAEQVCVVRLVDPADVLHKLVYVATNPVKDGLVDKVHHWPGVNGLTALLTGRTLHATRPGHFFRATGPMPAALALTFTLPPQLGDTSQLLAELRAQVAAVEAKVAADRRRTERGVLGRRAILRQDWQARPTTHEPRRNRRPQLAARSRWSRFEAIARNREFLAAYRDARAAWLAGVAAVFPCGTYWLRRFAHVPVAT